MSRTLDGRTALALATVVGVVLASGAAPALATEPPAREMTREVFGFFDTGDRDYMLNTADYDVLSTVAFFAIEAQPDGSLRRTTPGGGPTNEWDAWNSAWMAEVIELAHAHDAKVVLTVSRFGWSPASREETIALLSDDAARARLAAEVADADAVFLMAYPFRTRFSPKAGAVSPMAGLAFDVTEAVDRVAGQAGAAKVILGLPNYGWHALARRARGHGDSCTTTTPRAFQSNTTS